MLGKTLPAFAKILVWIGFVALATAASWHIIQLERAERLFRYSRDPERLPTARRLDPSSDRFANAEGDHWMKAIPAQPSLAVRSYEEAVRLNPYESFYWVNLGRVYSSSGEFDKAYRAYRAADRLDPRNYRIQNEIGNFLLLNKRVAEAERHHANVVRLKPALARSLWAVYWNLGQTPLTVARDLLDYEPTLLRSYFLDCLTWMSEEQGRQLWDAFRRREGFVSVESCRAYFDFLVAKADFAEARTLWHEIVHEYYQRTWDESEEAFWNGAFHSPLLFAGGLEWRILDEQPEGVRAIVNAEAGNQKNKCLWIHFEGKDAFNYSHVNHLLFVEPGQSYTLTYRANAFDLNTENGVYVKVSLLGPQRQELRGQPVMRTGNWNLKQAFTVPADCRVAEVAVCRNRGENAEITINGDVWFDDFKLSIVEGPTSGTQKR